MATEWHYTHGDAKHGPVTSAQLKQLASAGQLQPSDLIWKAGLPECTEARKLNGLFPDTNVSPVPVPVQFHPRAYVDISETIDAKMHAISAHAATVRSSCGRSAMLARSNR